MTTSNIRTLLARVKRLENIANPVSESIYLETARSFDEAIANGSMCATDGPIIRDCVLMWLPNPTKYGLTGRRFS